MKIGYIRVSSKNQNTSRQLVDVQCDKYFTDRVSGKNKKDRAQLLLMMDFAREGDTIIVHSIDRLARNLIDLRNIVEDLNLKGVNVHFEKEAWKFSKDKKCPQTLLMMNMLGGIAEYERQMIQNRQREGIDLALERDKKIKSTPGYSKSALTYKGNRALDSEVIKEVQERLRKGEKPMLIIQEMNVSKSTVYKVRKNLGELK